MSLTTYQREFIYNYSLQLLQQDMLTSSLFAGGEVGSALRGMVLPSSHTATTFTNPSEEALTGRLRSDAATLRQAGRNVGEATAIYESLASATTTLETNFKRMQEIIDLVQAGSMSSTAAQTEYTDIETQNQAIVSTLRYNGLYLMDGSGTNWTYDPRLTSVTATDAKLYIQTGASSGANQGFNLTLTNFSEFYGAAKAYNTANIASWAPASADLVAAEVALNPDSLRITGYKDMFNSRQASMESQQSALESQAAALDKVVANARATAKDMLSLLMEYLQGRPGSVFQNLA